MAPSSLGYETPSKSTISGPPETSYGPFLRTRIATGVIRTSSSPLIGMPICARRMPMGQRGRAAPPRHRTRAAFARDAGRRKCCDSSASDGTIPAMSYGMARSRTMGRTVRHTAEGLMAGTVRIEEECLELDIVRAREIGLLRQWMGRVNGSTYPQPYLIEGPPGTFRLYVGDAAERVRTQHGIR